MSLFAPPTGVHAGEVGTVWYVHPDFHGDDAFARLDTDADRVGTDWIINFIFGL